MRLNLIRTFVFSGLTWFSQVQALDLNLSLHEFNQEQSVLMEHSTDSFALEMAGRIRLEREILREDSRRWWASFNDHQRDQAIHRYKEAFQRGVNEAQLISQSLSGNNYCGVVEENLPRRFFGNDETFNQALIRGYQSVFAECFAQDNYKTLVMYDGRLKNLEKNLFQVQSKLILNRPSDYELRQLGKQLENNAAAIIKKHAQSFLNPLKQHLALETDELKKIKDRLSYQASLLAETINCKDLRGRFGERFNCQVAIVKPLHEIQEKDLWQFLHLDRKLGIFSHRIVYNQIFQAVAAYNQQTSMPNPIVAYALEDFKHSLQRLEGQLELGLKNLKSAYAFEVSQNLFENELNNADLWRNLFARDLRERVVAEFFEFKQLIESFERVQLSNRRELALLETIRGYYEKLLFQAAEMSFNLDLWQLDSVRIDLNDGLGSVLTIPVSISQPANGFLLGYSEREVLQIHSLLKL